MKPNWAKTTEGKQTRIASVYSNHHNKEDLLCRTSERLGMAFVNIAVKI